MLNDNHDVVLCGGLILDGEFNEIFIRVDTGDVLYESTTDNAVMCIGELTETNPIVIHDSSAVQKALNEKAFGEAIGIIYTAEGAIVITSEQTAERRVYGSHFQSNGDEFLIDLNIVDTLTDIED